MNESDVSMLGVEEVDGRAHMSLKPGQEPKRTSQG